MFALRQLCMKPWSFASSYLLWGLLKHACHACDNSQLCVPLRVWNCNFHVIRGKLESLVNKAAKIQEESKLMSVVQQWLEHDKNNVTTPAFGDLTQALAQQHQHQGVIFFMASCGSKNLRLNFLWYAVTGSFSEDKISRQKYIHVFM